MLLSFAMGVVTSSFSRKFLHRNLYLHQRIPWWTGCLKANRSGPSRGFSRRCPVPRRPLLLLPRLQAVQIRPRKNLMRKVKMKNLHQRQNKISRVLKMIVVAMNPVLMNQRVKMRKKPQRKSSDVEMVDVEMKQPKKVQQRFRFSPHLKQWR
uniref:Uncharacterized protein n=1 Tax=Brassica oleracea TaxID=3712 RepID=A0A3P6BTR0_BRAOL|nr:unnamed protein product [Brassica oleracea]